MQNKMDRQEATEKARHDYEEDMKYLHVQNILPEQIKVIEKEMVKMEDKTLIKTGEVLNELMEYGKVFADSKVFPDISSAAQGAVKILAGREVGLSPMQAINSFYFVSGKLGMASQTMGALIKKSGKYDYEPINLTTEGCTIAFYRVNNGTKEKLGESTFDKARAAKAGIINKDNWKNYPENMYFARALANGARWFCPDAISGFYTVEELQDLEPNKEERIITLDAETGEVKENGEKTI